jgi:acyl-[acyl-carrier-protein] desaturase
MKTSESQPYSSGTPFPTRRPAVTDNRSLDILLELEQVAETNLNRHLNTAKEWFPHEYVPWSRGRDFDGPLDGQAWSVEQSPLTDVARTSLIVNLLTEDNLPSYHHMIVTMYGRDGAWGTWVHRWTAEEGRHGIAIRDYLLAARVVNPVELERARMTHMSTGFTNAYNDKTPLHTIAYVSFQELATRVAHRNTGRVSGDPACDQLLARVAADENLHMIFYRNLLAAAFELAPDDTMRAVCDVVTTFQMPGHGIENFARKSVQIAMAGIYDLRIHCDEVVQPVLRNVKALDAPGLGPAGDQARDELLTFLAELDRRASRFTDRRAKIDAGKAARV